MSLLYAMRLNMALGRLGIDPRVVNQTHRDAARLLGITTGQNPQEVAILLTTQMPPNFQHRADASAIRKWIASGKLRLERIEVTEALQSLSFYNTSLPWRDFQRHDDEEQR